MGRMHYNNLEIRIPGSSCRPQLIMINTNSFEINTCSFLLNSHLVSGTLDAGQQGDVTNPHMQLFDQVFSHFLHWRLYEEHLVLDQDLMP